MNYIAICTLNSKYIHGSLSPWCLRAGVETYCHSEVVAEVVDATVNQPLEQVVEGMLSKNYRLIALSCYIWNISQTKKLVTALKQAKPDLPIVLGGPEVSFNAKEVLESCPEVDFILSGEGELPFAQLVDLILSGSGDYEGVFSLSYRKNGGIVVGEPYTTQVEPPSPYCPEFFAQLQGKISYVESSRGCPYSCAFCLSGRKETVRFFNLERVKGELIALANSGTQTVKFVDRTFNSSAKHCDAILTFLLEEYDKQIPKHITFHFEMAGDILRESTLELLAKMPLNYVQLEIGMQSFCEKTLEAVGRKTNISLLISNIQRLVAMENHHLHIDLIAGLPYEDLGEFEKSFDIAYDLGAEMLQLGFLKVLHGSEIGRNPQDFVGDYEKTPPYQVIHTPWLSEEDFALLEKIEDGVDRLYNSGRFDRTMEYMLNISGLTPFALFRKIAEGLDLPERPSLEQYTDGIYQLFVRFEGVHEDYLRDMMVLDRVETNSTGILPDSLKVEDGRLRSLTIALEQNPETARPPHGKRYVGILYSLFQGVYVDYPLKTQRKKHNREKFQAKRVAIDLFGENILP